MVLNRHVYSELVLLQRLLIYLLLKCYYLIELDHKFDFHIVIDLVSHTVLYIQVMVLHATVVNHVHEGVSAVLRQLDQELRTKTREKSF